jgi:hypothetical protein
VLRVEEVDLEQPVEEVRQLPVVDEVRLDVVAVLVAEVVAAGAGVGDRRVDRRFGVEQVEPVQAARQVGRAGSRLDVLVETDAVLRRCCPTAS